MCSAGRYSSAVGESSCTACPFHSFQETLGASSCQSCRYGYTASQGSSSLSDCLPQMCSNQSFNGVYSYKGESASTFSVAQHFCSQKYHGGTLPMVLNASLLGLSTFEWFGALALVYNFTMASYIWTNGSKAVIKQRLNGSTGSYCLTSNSTWWSLEQCSQERSFRCQVDSSYCTDVAMCPYGSKLDTTKHPFVCIACGPGYFKPTTSIFEACQLCPSGSFSEKSNSSSCQNCPLGTSSLDGASSCSLCSPGKYSSNVSSSCQICSPGYNSLTFGSSSCNSCPMGRYWTNSEDPCVVCPIGTYAEVAGSTNCTECQLSTTLTSGSVSNKDCSICFEGLYGKPPQKCLQCIDSPGVQCDVGSEVPFVQPGYFRAGSKIDLVNVIYSCYPSSACQSTGFNLETSCSSGYVGFVCGECDKDFYRAGSICKKCPSLLTTLGVLSAAVILVLFILVRLVISRVKIPTDVRISLQAMQILALFSTVTVKWPPSVLSVFGFLSFSNLNIELLSPECAFKVTFWQKYFLNANLPFILFFCVLILLSIHASVQRKKASFKLSRVMKRMVSLLSFSLITLHTLMISNSLSPLKCTLQSDGRWTLKNFPSENCFEGVWLSYSPWVIFYLFLYMVVIPLCLVGLFWRSKRTHQDPKFVQTYGNLVDAFNPMNYFWEVVLMTKRTLFLVGSTFVFEEYLSDQLRSFLCTILLFGFTWLELFFQPYCTNVNNIINST
jgi:hypothetical protein